MIVIRIIVDVIAVLLWVFAYAFVSLADCCDRVADWCKRKSIENERRRR
jgi:hypothetical protein